MAHRNHSASEDSPPFVPGRGERESGHVSDFQTDGVCFVVSTPTPEADRRTDPGREDEGGGRIQPEANRTVGRRSGAARSRFPEPCTEANREG